MTNIEKHTPGVFCWAELNTTDQNAAKAFYENLFAWTADDEPIGPEGVYTMFKLGGRHVGAACTLRPEQRSAGVPPNWLLYVSVVNADESAQRVPALGGKVHAGPFDVADAGRMAVLQDPGGATFAIWQANKSIGTQVIEVPGTLCWADLSTPDQQSATRFYSELFGWQAIAGEKDSSGYLHIKNGEQFIGGIPPAAHRQPNAPPHWLPYFAVADCDATASAARKAGAKLHLEPMTMENVGRMAVLADPQGAVFAIFQHLPRNG